MKTELAIKRELARVERAWRRRKQLAQQTELELWGARQALAWVMEQNAQAPAKAILPTPTNRRRK